MQNLKLIPIYSTPAGIRNFRMNWIKILIYFSLIVLSVDFAYKTIYGISYQNREACILYNFLPKIGFFYFMNILLNYF